VFCCECPPVVSTKESEMGEFLATWSETEYTNAGEVMQNVGKLQKSDSKNRYQQMVVGNWRWEQNEGTWRRERGAVIGGGEGPTRDGDQ